MLFPIASAAPVRSLIASAVVLLVTAVPSSALALTPPGAADLQTMTITTPSIGLLSTTKKPTKKEKPTSTSETARFLDMGEATRGKKGVVLRVKVASSDRKCEMKITWKDSGTTTATDTAGSDKTCDLRFDVPDTRNVVGDATASITVHDGSGNKITTVTKTFTVK